MIVARRDKGVHRIADLKGRRVGIPKGTVPHYFLDLELAKNGLGSKQIIPVYMAPEKLLPGLADGSVDAVATINSMAFRAKEKMGEKVIVFEDPGLTLNYSLLVTKNEYVVKYPGRIERLLKALAAAESYGRKSPEKKREIVVAALKLSGVEYEMVWKNYDDGLSLDNALLLTLEGNARWALDKGIVKSGQIPNYLTLINSGFLLKVAPDAVRLKR
jgi:NitT/TauT family transport system substrate-binding protein